MEHDQKRLHSIHTRCSLSPVHPIDCTRHFGNVRSRLHFLIRPKGQGWFTGVFPPTGRDTRSGACVRVGGNDRCCMTPIYERALIVGAGDGLSAAISRALYGAGLRIGLAARNTTKLAGLSDDLGAATHPCDASDPKQGAALFSAMDEALGGAPDVVVYNPSARVRGPLIELDPADVARTLAVTAYGGLLVAQAAAKRMLATRPRRNSVHGRLGQRQRLPGLGA